MHETPPSHDLSMKEGHPFLPRFSSLRQPDAAAAFTTSETFSTVSAGDLLVLGAIYAWVPYGEKKRFGAQTEMQQKTYNPWD